MAAQDPRPAPLIPRKIISFIGEVATFDSKVLQKELENFNALQDQLYVISISGVYRSGKSFLLNLMMKYLDYYCEHGTDEGWEESPMEIRGINWAKGKKNAVTHGVWFIVYPKLVQNRRLVLMDFQGTGDKLQSTLTLDKMILFYGLKLSNLLMLNMVGMIDTKDLDALGVCALEKDGEQLQRGFEDLVLLVRDWCGVEDLETLDEIEQTTKSKDVKKIAGTIRKAFHRIRTSSLPSPGKKVVNATETQGLRICDVEKEFTAACRVFLKDLLIDGPGKSPCTKSGYDFLYCFVVLGRDTIGKVQSLSEAATGTLVSEAWSAAHESFKHTLDELKKKDFGTEGEIKQALQAALKEAEKKYTADARVVKHASEERKRTDLDGLKELTEQVTQTIIDKLRQRKLEEEKEKLKAKAKEEEKKRLELEVKAERMLKKQAEIEQREREILEAEKIAEAENARRAENARLEAEQRARQIEVERQNEREIETERERGREEERVRKIKEATQREGDRARELERVWERKMEEEKVRARQKQIEWEREREQERERRNERERERERKRRERVFQEAVQRQQQLERLLIEAARIRQEQQEVRQAREQMERDRIAREKREEKVKEKQEEELRKQKEREWSWWDVAKVVVKFACNIFIGWLGL